MGNIKKKIKEGSLSIAVVLVVVLLIFAAFFAMVTCASMMLSKAMTESAISGAVSAVKMINDERPRPVEELGLDRAYFPDGDGAYMGAIRTRMSEFTAIAKATPEEIAAFDAMIRYASEKSQNELLQTIFSPDDNANAAYAANGYNVWTYITMIKKTSGIDFDTGTALLEAAALVKYSAENNIPLSLAVGVAQTESSFNPWAYSNKAACGPMQVVYDIHKALLDSINIKTKEELFTPDRGVQAGCYLLGRYLKAEGSITGGLKRYYGEFSSSYINQVLNNRHAFELFAEGIEKNAAAAIEREQMNWEKMTEPKTPVYTETNPVVSDSTPSNIVSEPPEYLVARTPQTTTIQATGNRGLTITPEEERKESLSYYNRTGTIIVARPQRDFLSEQNTLEEALEEQPVSEEEITTAEPLSAEPLRQIRESVPVMQGEEIKGETKKVTIQDLLNSTKTSDFIRE